MAVVREYLQKIDGNAPDLRKSDLSSKHGLWKPFVEGDLAS